MKISVFVPFGSQSQESGLMYLLANFLKVSFPEVVQLRCNGVFSMCDRDADTSWVRGMQSCFSCMSDQRALSAWSGVPVQDLSSFLLPDDVTESKRWVLSLKDHELIRAEYKGSAVFDVARESFVNRFGTQTPDLANKQHEQYLRRLLLSAVRMSIAAQRYHTKFAPDMSLVAGGRDYLTRAFVNQGRALRRDVSTFRWDINQRAIQISHPRDKKILACELVPEGIRGMRSDTRTWPSELSTIMTEIAHFLGLESDQLALPIAQ